MTTMTIKPSAPVDRTDLKTWTDEQLTFVAPFWIAKLEQSILDDNNMIASIMPETQPWLDCIKIRHKHREQLTFWKLVLSDRIFRVLPPSLRTFHRNGSVATHRGTPSKRHTTVGNWDKTLGIWN